ncbi:MAG TPA: NAD(P)H-binding protein [Acidimicrobiia bacterium]|nr:NAD(P)H-binding protein [Acidimicrobiia bacterium]
MPVIVVGADTPIGTRLVEHFGGRDREIRAFVTDPEAGLALRRDGIKVAVGDVTDDSHVTGACLNCFSAVLVMEAATDDRLRSFARDFDAVLDSWAAAVRTANVRRVIWVGDAVPPPVPDIEVAVVSPRHPDVVGEVFRLDDSATLD